MFTTFCNLVDYGHYRFVDTTATPTARDLCDIPHLKPQVEGRHTTFEPLTVFEPAKHVRFLSTFTSSGQTFHSLEYVDIYMFAYLFSRDLKNS